MDCLGLAKEAVVGEWRLRRTNEGASCWSSSMENNEGNSNLTVSLKLQETKWASQLSFLFFFLLFKTNVSCP